MRVKENRLQLVIRIGLSRKAGTIALHGLDEPIHDLVIERIHSATAQHRKNVMLQQGIHVAYRRRGQISLTPFHSAVYSSNRMDPYFWMRSALL
ncbi:hypothetical protein NKH18_49375 [Streptomyces sp. M10(2022)]